MRILDAYADEYLTIVTNDKDIIFLEGDTVSITMIDGFTVTGEITKIDIDKLHINFNGTISSYKYEKFAYLNNA